MAEKTRTLVTASDTETTTVNGEYEEEYQGAPRSKKSGKGWGSSGNWGWGYASMYLWFIIAPIVIWIILFTCKPSFVTDTVNGTTTINNQKLLLWTLIFSIIAWILIYAIYYCRY